MDLTNDDVAEILALLDSLPYDELDLQTPRFRLTLRRVPGGGWTEESQVLTEPAAVTSLPDGVPVASAASGGPASAPSASSRKSDISEMSGGTAGGVVGGDDERAGLVRELAAHRRGDALGVEPLFQGATEHRVLERQKERGLVERSWESVPVSGNEFRRADERHVALPKQVVERLDLNCRSGRRVRQDDVEGVHG